MAKFEMGDDFKLRIGDTDLSGDVGKVDLGRATGGPVTPGFYTVGETGCSLPSFPRLADHLAGLQSSSMTVTFDNSAGMFAPHTSALFFPAPKPLVRVTREIPDGRWQTFKWRLRSRFPRLLRRLKVRCRLYSFGAVLEPDEFGLSGTTTGPVSKGIEER